MESLMGESNDGVGRLAFEPRLTLQFRGSVITCDARLLARPANSTMPSVAAQLQARCSPLHATRNGRHALVGLLGQSVFGRLAGYQDVKDARQASAMIRRCAGLLVAGRLWNMRPHPARWAASRQSGSRHRGIYPPWLDLCGQWIGRVHGRRRPRGIVLDMDSSVSPTHGEQEMGVWNGHFECTCYHRLFAFNQFADLERCALCPGNVHSAHGSRGVLTPVMVRYLGQVSRLYFRADAGFANPEA